MVCHLLPFAKLGQNTTPGFGDDKSLAVSLVGVLIGTRGSFGMSMR